MARSLAQHLAAGYDYFVHGRQGWTPVEFATDMREDPELEKAARTKLAQVEPIARLGKRCQISNIQARIIRAALDSLGTTGP